MTTEKIKPGDLIKMREIPVKFFIVSSVPRKTTFLPVKTSFEVKDLALGARDRNPNDGIPYTPEDPPVLFLKTVKIPKGTLGQIQLKSFYVHCVLWEGKTYQFFLPHGNSLENEFFVAMRANSNAV